MNMLMLGWELPPHNSGGLGVACYHLSKALAEQGADIDFVVPYTAEHPDIDYMRIHSVTPITPEERLHLQAYDSKYVSEEEKHILEAGGLTDIRAVQRRYVRYIDSFVRHHNVDIIHAHDWLTMEAGVRAKELTGAPLIIHVHATEFDRSGEFNGNPIVHEIEQQALLMADKIFAVSAITKNIIVQNYGIPADKVDVVYNAIDVHSFAPDYLYSKDTQTYQYLESLKADGYIVVGTVTRFTVQKGLTHLMKAAKKVSDQNDKTVFLFAGDGEQRNELITLAAEMGISDRVFFTGFIRGRKWRDAYSVSDVFVMSSVSEPFGLTALEAAHHDTALAISKQSGVGEVLQNIYRFDFWDTDLLASQLVDLANSAALLEEMKRAVKQEYADITWGDVARQCINTYNGMCVGARI